METIFKKAYDLGFAYERDYMGCAQCVIAALQDTLDIRNSARTQFSSQRRGLPGAWHRKPTDTAADIPAARC